MRVELVDHMGSDLSVVNAARVSFNKISKELSEGDKKLIRYLANNGHWTPFGHCFLSFRVYAPIFVARQLAKHQVGLVWNEVSRRYVDDTPEMFVPTEWRGRPENGVKQGSGESIISILSDRLHGQNIEEAYSRLVNHSLDLYNRMLEEGVAPEMARMVLLQSMNTEWIWSGSLMAFSRVCNLRLDPHAQKETSVLVSEIDKIAGSLFEYSWKALRNE